MTSREPGGRSYAIETLVGYILLLGLLSSIVLLLTGMAWQWLQTGSLRLDYAMGGMNLFRFTLTEVGLIAHGAIGPRILISLGVTTLLLTPYLRVLVSLVYFAAAERNLKYSCFSGFVLVVLTYSLFLS